MMSTQTDRELSFRSDFAGRVLAKADAIRRRRRVIGTGGVVAMGAIAIAVSTLLSAPARHAVPAPVAAAVSIPRIDVSANAPTDPLQFLLPDAEPVAQFADDYATANYGGERKAAEFLLANDVEPDASDL